MSLSGQQRRALQDALMDAFPNTASLEQMLAFELEKSLGAIAGEGSLQNIVFQLIQTANSHGWVEDLIRAACNSNPGNPQLRTVAEELLPKFDRKTFDETMVVIETENISPGLIARKKNLLGEIPVRGDEASEVGADYTKLREFLEKKQFGNADNETAKLMLKIANRERIGYFDIEDFKKFPSKDLATINKLWLKGSNGRFGFSVQKQILMELGGNQIKYDDKLLKLLINQLEWKEKNDYDFIFKQRAKKGHLPLGIYVKTAKNAKLMYKWSAAVEKAIERENQCWWHEIQLCPSWRYHSPVKNLWMCAREKWDEMGVLWEMWLSRKSYRDYFFLLSRKDL